MDVAFVLFATAKLIFTVVGSPIFKEIQSIWDYQSDIRLLSESITFIRDVLSDVEEQQIHDAHVVRALQRLREAFYDAEDFLDRVETEKQKLEAKNGKMEKAEEEIVNKANGKGKRSMASTGIKIKSFTNKTCKFFSTSNQAKYAVKVHKAIKRIRNNLDAIAQDLQKFGLKEPINRESTNMNARASGSYVNATGIVGRDDDKRKLIELLLRSSTDQMKVPVVSIIGIGGMGKTSVAQLVYDDKSWQETCRFELKLWVSNCQKFDLKFLLKTILLFINPHDTSLDKLEEGLLKEQFVKEIGGKKYLLVLDDVQNESRLNWEIFEELLKCGNKDSRVLVTTRSRKVAIVMGSESTYELQGLSDENSWLLFERSAFQGNGDENLVRIGKLIVPRCGRVPLALKTIGCLLYGEDIRKWELVRDIGLEKIEKDTNQLIPILKISYDDLDSALKQCFSFCALFPKNHLMSKEILCSIWVANVHFVINQGETLEFVCDKSLKILYNRGFIEAAKRNKWGEVTHFKMHDLMHDLAKEVAGEGMYLVDSVSKLDSDRLILKENVRHFGFMCSLMKTHPRISTFELKGRRLRTFLQHYTFPWYKPERMIFSVDNLVSDCPVLRALDMQRWGIEKLTSSIGKLIHLRYLDLSYNEFEKLPDSLTELWNLQTLVLERCFKLKELPIGIEKLISLRHLNLAGCKSLTHLPIGLILLTSIQVLDISSCKKLNELPVGIEKLTKLQDFSLTSCLSLTRMPSEISELTSLRFLDISCCNKLESLPMGMEKLINLRYLILAGCTALTRILSEVGSLTSLEVLDMSNCPRLMELPMGIENLISLKVLKFAHCRALTHMPCKIGALSSLEVLDLSDCDKLEKLPIDIEKLINLKDLNIKGCDALTQMPSGMGGLRSLCKLHKFIVGHPEFKHTAQLHELEPLSKLQGDLTIEIPNNITLSGSRQDESLLINKKSLRKLEIKLQDNQDDDDDNVPMNHERILDKLQPHRNLETFIIHQYQGVRLPSWMAKNDFAFILPNLVGMHILYCGKCRHLPPVSRLPCLKYLELRCLPDLEYIQEIVPYASFFPSLEQLILDKLPKLKSWYKEQSFMLPSFPCLLDLGISHCPELKVTPILLSFVIVLSSATAPVSSSLSLFDEVCKNGGRFSLSINQHRHSMSLWMANFDATNIPSTIMDETCRKLSNQLTNLEFDNCSGLKTLSGLKHLTALQKLCIQSCCDFTWENNGQCSSQGNEDSWKEHTNLEHLTLCDLPKMVRLPAGIQFVTSLKHIEILRCNNLTVPEGIFEGFEYEKHPRGDEFFWVRKSAGGEDMVVDCKKPLKIMGRLQSKSQQYDDLLPPLSKPHSEEEAPDFSQEKEPLKEEEGKGMSLVQNEAYAQEMKKINERMEEVELAIPNYVYTKTGNQAFILNRESEETQDKKAEDRVQSMPNPYTYFSQNTFSDENPNACSIM